ncbi:MAG: IS5 family transposase [Leptolyngbyaceae bacterium]|nr:IS5 family transposase [Leptolyngbyaceae bacterium]
MSDAEWQLIQPLLPQPKRFAHPRTVNLREMLNAIFYVQRTGCQWDLLLHDFPPHSTVYSYFSKWQRKGIWQSIHDQFRHQIRTEKMGREVDSAVAIADSQSVATTEKRRRSTAMTGVSRLKGVTGILSLTRKDS